MHARWSGEPSGVHLSDEWVLYAFQRRNELVLKAQLRIEQVAWIKHGEQELEYVAIVLPSHVRQGLHRDVVLCASEPADNVLAHLGLVLTIAERASVFENLRSSWWRHGHPASPERSSTRAPIINCKRPARMEGGW